MPADIRVCFERVTHLPAGDWTKEQTTRVLAELRSSELGKTDCGKRALAFYDDLRKKRGGR